MKSWVTSCTLAFNVDRKNDRNSIYCWPQQNVWLTRSTSRDHRIDHVFHAYVRHCKQNHQNHPQIPCFIPDWTGIELNRLPGTLSEVTRTYTAGYTKIQFWSESKGGSRERAGGSVTLPAIPDVKAGMKPDPNISSGILCAHKIFLCSPLKKKILTRP